MTAPHEHVVMQKENEMNKHTPGPWSYRKTLGPQSCPSVSGPIVVQETTTGDQIACLSSLRSEGQPEANARLIAAAPEMLDLLRQVRDVFDSGLQNTAASLDDIETLLARIDDA